MRERERNKERKNKWEWEREKGKKERNLWFFGGTEWKTRRKRYPPKMKGGRQRWRVQQQRGTAIFQTARLPSAEFAAAATTLHPSTNAQWSFVIFSWMSTQTPRLRRRRRTPFRSSRREFTLVGLGTKIRGRVAESARGVTFNVETESSVGNNYIPVYPLCVCVCLL